MITTPAKTDFKIKKRCYGDSAILYGITQTPIFVLLFGRFSRGVLLILKQWVQFTSATMSNGLCPFRYNHGIQTCGFLLSANTIGAALIINSEHVWAIFYPFAFALGALPFFYDWPQIWVWITHEIHSPILLGYTALIFLSSIVSITMCYIGKGNSDITKRGESYLYNGLIRVFPKVQFSEFFICGIIEPSLLAGSGLIAWIYFDDHAFGTFTLLVASSEMISRVKTKTTQLHRKAYMDV